MISFKKGFPYFSLNKWCNSEKNIDKKGMIPMKSKHVSKFEESLPHQINVNKQSARLIIRKKEKGDSLTLLSLSLSNNNSFLRIMILHILFFSARQ